MKHKQHIPDRIEWASCVRCGEPKRPHRICTTHLDICAMRDEEWKAHNTAKSLENTNMTQKEWTWRINIYHYMNVEVKNSGVMYISVNSWSSHNILFNPGS